MSEDILHLDPPSADIRIPYGLDANQFGDLRVPAGDGPHPLAILIHGGYWRAQFNLQHLGHACAALTAAGLATWNLEYRRIGQPGGGWPGTMDDVRAGALFVLTFASRFRLDPSRIAVAGHSAGGQLALWFAAQRILPLRSVVALAAVSDLEDAWERKLSDGVTSEFLGGTPAEYPERYGAASPLALLPIATPQWLIHGSSDTAVPFRQSEHFAELSGNAEFIPLTGTGHFELIDPRSQQWLIVQRTIANTLCP